MKCPKCQYLGFDGHTRCRHCGYDLSLSATTEVPQGETGMPFDAPLADTAYRPEPSARAQARAAIQKRAASRTPQPESFDLPLFATPGVDDRPALPASRPPLSVRRAAELPRSRAAAAAAFAPTSTPESILSQTSDAGGAAEADAAAIADADTQPRIEPRLEFDAMSLAPPPDTDPDPDLALTLGGTPLAGDVRAGGGALILPGREASASVSAGFARVRPEVPADTEARPAPAITDLGTVAAESTDDDAAGSSATNAPGSAAPLGLRMLAGLVDVAILAAVDAGVVVATLRATGVEWSQVSRLPLAPLGVFLFVLAIGYLAMCTVLAGRTFGKAAFGLAVVEAGGRPVRLAPAVVRALIQVLTVPAAGIGFLPALLGADRRSLYDRLAGTDVVRDARGGEAARPE